MRSRSFRAVAVASATALVVSIAVLSAGDPAGAAVPDLPSLSVTQLMSTVASSSTVEVVDLDDTGRALVNVDDGQSVTAYLVSGATSTKAADFRAVAFSTVGSVLQADAVIGNRGFGASFTAFLSLRGMEQQLRQRDDVAFSTMANGVNRSGTVVGQFAKGNFWQAFSITPTDEDHDGVPDTWFKDEQPADHVNDLFADLGATRPGASVATAINDNGTVVGIYQSATGEWLPFGTAGGPGDRPNDIANSNDAVGLNTLTQRALLFPGTVLDSQGTFGNTSAVSVNERTQVVGTSANFSGFYYDAGSGMVAINDRIPVAADRRSFSPTRINNGGVIAANASNKAFLLAPAITCGTGAAGAAACPCEVTAVGWQDSRLTPNPAALGGGLRVFADKSSPGAATDGRDITVEATAAAGGGVYFKVFDVDDPTSDAGPIDANGPAGNDNRGVPQTLPVSVLADDSGHARATLHASAHPGDNYRVAAGCDITYLDGLSVSGAEVVDATGATLPTPGAKVTPMLTVWRRLHIERDDMTAVHGNKTLGTITKIDKTRTKLTVGSLSTSDGATMTGLEPGRYENGAIVAPFVGTIVFDNTASVVTVTSPVPATVNPVGSRFTMVDDDDYARAGTLQGDEGVTVHAVPRLYEFLQDSDDPAVNLFAPAYIQPVYDADGSGPAPFRLNLTLNAAGQAFLDQSRGSGPAESGSYWVAYVQHGYQPDAKKDNDPDQEKQTPCAETIGTFAPASTVVSATTVPRGGHDSVIYLETQRECGSSPLSLSTTVPHEVGHQFGLEDTKNAGTLMNESSGGTTFLPAELNALRWRVNSPGI